MFQLLAITSCVADSVVTHELALLSDSDAKRAET